MNKKFSTLVAALLVSGVSYAVVSQIDGAAVANGVQTTAVADFRALTPEQAQIAADKLTAANIANMAGVPAWKGAKIGAATYNALVTSDGSSYLTLKNGELVLSDDMTATLVTVAYTPDGYLTYDSKYLITNGISTKVSTSTVLADVVATLAADERLVTMYDVTGSSKVTFSTDFNGSIGTKNVVLAAELYPSIPTAISVVETPAVAVTEFKGTEVTNAGDDPTATAKFLVGIKSNGEKVLKFSENQFLKSTNGVISMVASADEASTVTIDADHNVSLNSEGDYLVIATDGTVKTSNKGALSGLNKVFAYITHNGTAAIADNSAFTGASIYLAYAAGENISGGNNKATFIHFSTKAAESVVVANANVEANLLNMPKTMKLAGATKTLTFTGADGNVYALKIGSDVVGAKVTFVPVAQTGTNFETAANGALKTAAGKFVTLKDGELVLAAAEASDGTQVYAWKQAANKLPVLQKSETTAMDAVTILSTSQTEVAAALAAGTSYIKYDLTAAQGALMELTKKYYTISAADAANFLSEPTYNSTTKTWSLVNKAALASDTEQLNSVWVVSEITDKNGRVTNYSFANKDNGKKLAFDLKVTAANTWAAEVNPEGKYFEFFVDQQGRISFVANEKNVSFEGKTYSNTNRWYVDFTASSSWTVSETNKDQLKIQDASSMIVVSDEIDEQINWLNVTAGDGHGFDVIIKNAKGDKITSVANDLTDKRITAVKGPDLNEMVSVNGTLFEAFAGTTLEDQLFFMVEGDYEFEAVPAQKTGETALAYQKRKAEQAKKQLDAFRASKFVVVDTLLYSSIIDDVTKDFFKFTVAKGSEFISATGYEAAYTGNSDDITFDYKTGKYYRDGEETKDFDGLTRSLNNAAFTVTHVRGSEINEPIQITTAEAPYFYTTSGVKNYQGIFGHSQAAQSYSVALKEIGGSYYVGAHTSGYAYVYAGLNNNVDYTKVNGIVNIYNAKYNNKGEIVANENTEGFAWFKASNINANAPEGQYLVSYDKVKGTFTLTNRESQLAALTSASLKTVTDKDGKIIDNVYAIVASNIAAVDTIKIVPAADSNEFTGYKNYAEKELKTTIFNFSFKSGVEGLEDVYVAEPHATNDHVMRMTTTKEDASKFKLVKFAAKADTVRVSTAKYVTAEGKEVEDKVVALAYAIYNENNGEYVAYDATAANENFYCDPKNTTDAAKAQKFILKEKNEGYQLIAVEGLEENATFSVATGKTYGAFKANKLSKEANIYKVTDNDIFQITDVNAAIYHKFEAAYDTIRIYKSGMVNDQTALYAKTAAKATVSGSHFLAMDHQADVEKAKFSFFVDTAYIRDSYKPQYLLAIDAQKANKLEDCDIPDHDMHDTNVVDTVYGKFMVNMVDSIAIWGDKHSNPYWFDQKNYARLGFVNAKHLVSDEKLVIVRDDAKLQTKADTIDLANNDNKIGAYAFRYVNSDSEKFVIETAYKNQIDGTTSAGYIKWLNGTPVVVNDRAIAEEFELKKTESAPTANDKVTASEVSVIASTGTIIVKGAAGKTVAISNILGQTIVNTVLTSDNATIAVPAGIVVVAVEGEEAVKTVVK